MDPRPAENVDVADAAALLDAEGISGWSARALAEACTRADRFVAVVGPRGAPFGVAVAGWVLDEAELLAVAVARPFRRRGAGRALLITVVQATAQAGVSRLHLEVRARNDAAIALYRHVGFIVTGRRPRFYGDDDAVVMTRVAPPVRLDDLTVVVLAGGQGRRLGGVIKPLLRRSTDETLVERISTVLGPQARAMVLVAPLRLHPAFAEVWPHPMVADEGQGPARALGAAASTVRTAWLAAVAADLVGPDAALMAELAAHRSDTIDAVVPVVQGYDQPLFALYRTAAMTSGEAPRSMRAWLGTLSTARVQIDAADARAALEDVDTPEDVDRFGLRSPAE